MSTTTGRCARSSPSPWRCCGRCGPPRRTSAPVGARACRRACRVPNAWGLRSRGSSPPLCSVSSDQGGRPTLTKRGGWGLHSRGLPRACLGERRRASGPRQGCVRRFHFGGMRFSQRGRSARLAIFVCGGRGACARTPPSAGGRRRRQRPSSGAPPPPTPVGCRMTVCLLLGAYVRPTATCKKTLSVPGGVRWSLSRSPPMSRQSGNSRARIAHGHGGRTGAPGHQWRRQPRLKQSTHRIAFPPHLRALGTNGARARCCGGKGYAARHPEIPPAPRRSGRIFGGAGVVLRGRRAAASPGPRARIGFAQTRSPVSLGPFDLDRSSGYLPRIVSDLFCVGTHRAMVFARHATILRDRE